MSSTLYVWAPNAPTASMVKRVRTTNGIFTACPTPRCLPTQFLTPISQILAGQLPTIPPGEARFNSCGMWFGEFNIEVTHWSLHGCDTLEVGQIKVFPPPEAIAGPNDVICEFADIQLRGDTAWNHSSLLWTTTGDGTFSDDMALHPIYYLGPADSAASSVTLVLTSYGLAENETCIPAVDSVTFEFSSPDICACRSRSAVLQRKHRLCKRQRCWWTGTVNLQLAGT